jgi:hypothetical protein
MQFFIRSANALDLACIGAVVGDRMEEGDPGARGVRERLALAWEVSRQVWIASDRKGVPAAVFGAAPMEGDESTGVLWTLFLRAFEEGQADGRAAFSLVLDEMLRAFDRLETMVDTRRPWVLGMLKSVGFTIDPVGARWPGDLCHRVWLDGEGGRKFRSPN